MSGFFDRVSAGPASVPERVVLYGTTGVGKTSAACSLPKPVVMPLENGLDALPHVQRLPKPRHWADACAMLDEMYSSADRLPYKTLVVDTIDRLEELCWLHVCEHNFQNKKWKSLESPGYGKGYSEARKVWAKDWFPRLEKLHDKGFHIAICAQAQVKLWNNPFGENYDRYMLALEIRAAKLLQEWCSDQFFCQQWNGVSVSKSKVTGRLNARGQSTDQRIAYTTWTAAWNAKHRVRVPDEIEIPDPLSGSFYQAWLDARANPEGGRTEREDTKSAEDESDDSSEEEEPPPAED